MVQKKKPTYGIAIAILALVVVGFVIGPLIGAFSGQTRGAIVFGKYKSREIVYIQGNYFHNQVQQFASRFSQQNISLTDEITQLIWRQSFTSTLIHAAALEAISNSGMELSESAIDKTIAQSPAFQNETGFDATAYRALTQQERMRLRSLQTELSLREQYDADFNEGVLVGNREVEFITSIAEEERQIAYTAISIDAIADETLDSYIQEKSDEFTRIRIADFIFNGTIDEVTTIRSQLNDNGSNFYEKRLEFSDDQSAALENESAWYFLAELREQYPTIGTITQLRDYAANSVSEPFRISDTSFALFLIEDREDIADIDRVELTDYAKRYLQNNDVPRLQELLSELSRTLQEKIDATPNASLVEVGIKNNFDVKTSEFFPLNYGNVDLFPPISSDDAGLLDGIETNDALLRQIFTLEQGVISQPLASRDKQIVLQVIDIRDAPKITYDEFSDYYRDQMSAYITSDQERLLVRQDLVFDNFEEIYNEIINPTQ